MKHRIILTASCLSAIGAHIAFFAEGYFANPALLGVLITPLVFLSLLFFPALVAVVYLVRFFLRDKTRQNTTLTILGFCGFTLFVAGHALPGGLDAFVFRMKQFSDTAYYELAANLRSEFDKRGIRESSDLQIGSKAWESLHDSLREAHPILQINSSPPRIAVDEDSVIVFWGGGRTGSYEIMILLDANEPHGLASGSRRTVKIHERVLLGYRS